MVQASGQVALLYFKITTWGETGEGNDLGVPMEGDSFYLFYYLKKNIL